VLQLHGESLIPSVLFHVIKISLIVIHDLDYKLKLYLLISLKLIRSQISFLLE